MDKKLKEKLKIKFFNFKNKIQVHFQRKSVNLKNINLKNQQNY